jgi:hypothetical protein
MRPSGARGFAFNDPVKNRLHGIVRIQRLVRVERFQVLVFAFLLGGQTKKKNSRRQIKDSIPAANFGSLVVCGEPRRQLGLLDIFGVGQGAVMPALEA